MGTGPEHSPTRKSTERPCYKLSADLLKTYKGINELFYEQKRKRQSMSETKSLNSNQGVDDDQGNYIVRIGEEIAGRYTVQESLGKGSFGVVVKAHDEKRDESVAIKVIKNKAQFFQQAKVEIEILTKLNSQASEEHNIVKLKKVFSWKEHLCLVFELLSFNLYDLLKYTKFNGISLSLVRKFAYQILKTLEFLSSSAIGVVHCDLKPENILLKNPKRSGIKVIDFGSSCFATKKMFKYIQSRFYRSPEVILGLPYDCAIDMWSLGCVLVEMHTGQPIFDGKDEAEQLIKMAAILGPQPQKMVEQSPKRKNFFQWDMKLKRWTLDPPNRDPSQYPRKNLEDILGVSIGGPGGRRKGQAGHSETDYLHFVDFVRRMFDYSAPTRLTASAALQHPFLAPLANELAASNNSHPSPCTPRIPASPSYPAPKDLSARLPSECSFGAQSHVSSQDFKWHVAGHSVKAVSPKPLGQEPRLSLLGSTQGTTAYQPADAQSDKSDSASLGGRTQSNPHMPQTMGHSMLSRTQSVPHVAQSAATRTSSPSQAALDPYRQPDYQSATFTSPTSPSLRLKPKQPGGTAQPEHLAPTLTSPLSTPNVLGPRSMSFLGSPVARMSMGGMMYAESPNSGKYAPGTPVTPRTGGGLELRQYITGPLGSPLPAADGRKWLPSPMVSDVSRKLLPMDSPNTAKCGEGELWGESPEKMRSLSLGPWKSPSFAEISYLAARHTLHHGGAEPMMRPVQRELVL